MIRSAAAAGQFFPGEPGNLGRELGEYIKPGRLADKPAILVSPHAGLLYSGPTAGKGYGLLVGQAYKRVILLGSSHKAGFSGVALDDHEAWETPLGSVAVDEGGVNQISDNQLICKNIEPHRLEHSLEMQLIFLQYVLKPGFKIIPILLGQIQEKGLMNIGTGVAEIMDKDTLLVISSDLSHYPKVQIAEASDHQVIEAFCAGDPEGFLGIVRGLERAGDQNLLTAACGAKAMAVGLYAAKKLGEIKFKLIDYTHSGMITGDNTRVVGYAAIAGFKI